MYLGKNYIFGYIIINDVPAMNIQLKYKQWFKANNLDTFFPMVPCIVHKSEFPFLVKLNIKCNVNNNVRCYVEKIGTLTNKVKSI